MQDWPDSFLHIPTHLLICGLAKDKAKLSVTQGITARNLQGPPKMDAPERVTYLQCGAPCQAVFPGVELAKFGGVTLPKLPVTLSSNCVHSVDLVNPEFAFLFGYHS